MSAQPASGITRRTFLISTAVVGGGLTLSVLTSCAGKRGTPGEPAEVSAWLTIDPQDNILLRVPFHECGNGAMTMVAMLMAEELRADWSKVRAEPIDLNRDTREQGVYKAFDSPFFTFSGRSTSPDLMRAMRQAGASARERLKTAAALQWNVPVAEVKAHDSVITHASTKRTLRYGEVAAAAAGEKLNGHEYRS
jgi:isoquinoline 1-oxidoreductase beta subunit